MTNSEFADFMAGATWGAEVDLMNADLKIPLPEGNSWSREEDSGHNDAGICIDPGQRWNMFGAELNTRPCSSPGELHKTIMEIAHLTIPHDPIRLPETPHVIHVHIRIPELFKRPDVLRHLLVYGEKWDARLQDVIFQKLEPDMSLCANGLQWGHYEYFAHEMNIARRRGYQPDAIDRALTCKSDDVLDIVRALHPNWDDPKCEGPRGGHQLWSIEPGAPMVRPCYNYGHLLDLETIEFRAFVATVDEDILRTILEYPAKYLYCALRDEDPMHLVQGATFEVRGDWGTDRDPQRLRARRAATDVYWVDPWMQEEAVRLLLSTGDITLADLNYPQMFVDEGFYQ